MSIFITITILKKVTFALLALCCISTITVSCCYNYSTENNEKSIKLWKNLKLFQCSSLRISNSISRDLFYINTHNVLQKKSILKATELL